ncbi:MAG: hypothetical protein E7052_07475 [Lentisphaerae bacterium]|nr:hypothetical protein [Lentisphaerota bacterium]
MKRFWCVCVTLLSSIALLTAATKDSVCTLSIQGPSSVTGSAVFTCYAKYVYNSSRDGYITPNWSVSNSNYAYFSGNTLYAKPAGYGKSITITASIGTAPADPTKVGSNYTSASKIVYLNAPAAVSSLTITGPGNVAPGGSAAYSCQASFSDGSSKTVTAAWSSSNSKYAWFSGSTLYSKKSAKNKCVTITASYNGKSVSRKVVVAKNIAVTSLTIEGVSSIKAGSSASYSCTANYNDGSVQTVAPTWKSSKKSYAYFVGSTLITLGKGSGKTVTVTASFGGKKATRKITIEKVRNLTGLSISGSSSVKSGKSITLKCYALYSDGSKTKITPSWSLNCNLNVNGYNMAVGNYASVNSSGKVSYFGKLQYSYSVPVVASYGGYSTTKNVTLKGTGKSTPGNSDDGNDGSGALRISGPASMKFGSTGRFYLYSGGKQVTSSSVSWSRSGTYIVVQDKGSYAYVKANSKPSGNSAKATVIAKYKGKKATKTVTVYR